MNALTTDEQALSPQTMEHVLGTGDISKLTVPQRVEFYRAACRSLGLNPLTRPIRFLSFQGQMQAYFTRDGTDQLRKNNKITLHVMDKQQDGDVYVVTVRARMPDGREDEDIGAVTLGRLQGDSRANALMKCLTKAKRRVTLSICGLGWTSEDELDTMPGAVTFDHDDARDAINDAVPMPAAAAATPRPPRKVEKTPTTERTDTQWEAWLDKLRAAMAVLRTTDEVAEVGNRSTVGDALKNGPPWVQREISAILADHHKRVSDQQTAQSQLNDDPFAPELADVEIINADKMAAG